jgi:lon-related putative ATP-dependent protease
MASKDFNSFKLSPEQLRWTCDPDSLGVKTTAEIPPCKEIIGQQRAIQAIRMGLNMKSHGYNIYVSGLTGTGKTTTIKKLLEQMDPRLETPNDICYVNNFNDFDSPLCLVFPAGQGKKFSKDMDKTILSLQKHIPQIYESDRYKHQRKEIIDAYSKKAQETIQTFENKVQKAGFSLVQVQAGLTTRPEIYPVIEKDIVPWQKLGELVSGGKITQKDVELLRKKHDRFIEELQQIASVHQEMEKETQETLQNLEQEAAKPTVHAQIHALKKKYPNEKITSYLDGVEEHLLQNLDRFTKTEGNNAKQTSLLPAPKEKTGALFLDYKVNVIVDNSKTKGTPIIIETAPSIYNLFGVIERSWDPSGFWKTDFTKIKAGSLLRANGGHLVFNLVDALTEPGVWKVLKRTLKNQQLIIQSMESLAGFATSALKPEPIDINLKVLVIGDEYTYRLIYDMDDEFKKIFKIRADFDTVMTNNQKTIKQYLSFACKITKDENLFPMDSSALSGVIEYGVTLSGRKDKLSTRFSDIADIIREAHYWASASKRKTITVTNLDKAIQNKEYRLKKIEEKIQEMIEDGTIMIETRGNKVGQVNGLSVYDLGDYAFGKPSKITAEVAMGKSGIINIEREAGMGGRSYNKGVLIIAGYLRSMYAQDKPLTMTASLCFEQSYSGVDGDSASSTEIYALLSALSGFPLRQDIAITGSVNQKGEIQPIGGVNYKIHGFYDVCRSKGLTGRQGVIIPRTNISDLMLRKDVVEAVGKGKFNIWAVETIDQGIEILTGKSAGKRDKKGAFPQGTIHYMANQKLAEFAEKMKDYEGNSI